MIQELVLKGDPICHGVAIGTPLFFSFIDHEIPEFSVSDDRIEFEIARYRNALEKSRSEIKELQLKLENEKILEAATILEAHLQIMHDPFLTIRMEEEIRATQRNAEAVLQAQVLQYQKKFDALEDPFFRERFNDLQDISRRIISHLRCTARTSLANIPPNSIVFSRELSASDTAEADMVRVGAFVTECGGGMSHAAIVAKARGIPYVSNISLEKLNESQHGVTIVDGRSGEIILNPTPATLEKYQNIEKNLDNHLQNLANVGGLPTETYDGYPVRLSANLELTSEFDLLHQHGGHGVGLFRSEYLFFAKEQFPSEEEQVEIYSTMVQRARGLPIVIRTFDLGGDKVPSHHQKGMNAETISFGCRAIRFMLKEHLIFKQQLRAILRAAVLGELGVMFPMISTLSELMEAKVLLSEAKNELADLGIPFGNVRVGCMVEVPSAALIADQLAAECDFLSIGTNDLVQYALAVDRTDHLMSFLYTPTHPSVLRLIKLVIHEANHHGIPVTICGEVAADPRFTPLLLGLGVHELSVATRYIPVVKHAIRSTSIVEASQLAEKALTLKTAAEIQELLTAEYRRNVPEDCFYNY